MRAVAEREKRQKRERREGLKEWRERWTVGWMGAGRRDESERIREQGKVCEEMCV